MPLNRCIPNAVGVPFEEGPPNWLVATATSQLDTTLDDPRWRGATQQSLTDNGINPGNANEAEFRALYHTDQVTNQTYLYLSWQVQQDMDGATNGKDKFFVGFVPDTTQGGSGPAFIVEFTLSVGQGQDGTRNGLNVPNFGWTIYTRSGTQWNNDGSELNPFWLADTRLWANSPTFSPAQPNVPWAFQLKIPKGVALVKQGPSGGTGPTTTLGTAFKLWYAFIVSTPTNGQAKELTFPDGGSAYQVTLDQFGNITGFPDPNSATSPWGTITLAGLGGNPACAQGVSLNFSSVGTTNLNSSVISLNKSNNFFADPINNSGQTITAGTISARFRLANWGSNFQGGTWDDIPVGHNVVSTLDIPPLPALPAGHPILSDAWLLTPAEQLRYQQTPHVCMLVQLTSTAGIQFDSDSVVKNMDFATTSVHSEEAEISISGLPKTAEGHRDVYLYVERINLPPTINYDPCAVGDDSPPASIEATRLELNRRAAEGNLSLKDALTAGLPTYRIHVYHDTARVIMLGGTKHNVLHPQPSFGYFLLHDSSFFGWNHRIEGAEQIAPNYYKIPAIQEGTSAKVRVTVEALEQPRGARDSGFMVQSTVGNKGDFVLVVPDSKAGLSECIRRNDFSPTFPWNGPTVFGTELGHVDAVSLIQSNYGLTGNLELVARVGERLVHFWREVSPGSTWNGPTTIVGQGVSGNPALIQSRYGKRGNFELVVPLTSGGIAHYWRGNDDLRPSWQLGTVFGKELGHVDAVALIQSNFGQPLPGHLEVIARMGDRLIHYWRDSGPAFKWGESIKFYEGAAGIPGFIQSNFGSKGNFEVVTPSIKGGMVHLQRENEVSPFAWKEVTTFGTSNVTTVSLLQSNFTTSTNANAPGPGDFEVAARVDGRTAHFSRGDEAPFTWTGPTAYACS